MGYVADAMEIGAVVSRGPPAMLMPTKTSMPTPTTSGNTLARPSVGTVNEYCLLKACPGLRMIAEKNAIDSNVNIIFLVFIRKLFILDSRKRLEVTFDVTTS